MGTDPTCVSFARALVKDNIDISPVVGKALLDHIDSLTRIIDRIDEDKDEQ